MEARETPIRVLIVDDDDLFRRLLERILTRCEGDPMVCATVGTFDEAMSHVEREAIDVVVLDGSLPDSPGLSGIGRILKRVPGAAVIVFTGYENEELARQAMREGAQDYVVKGEEALRTLPRTVRLAFERARRAASR